VTASAYLGGASTSDFGYSFNIDVVKGKTVTLEDLLGSKYKPLVNALISAQLCKDYGEIPGDYDLLNVGGTSDFTDGVGPHFYLTPTHLGFIYDKYTIYPGAASTPVTKVPISDLPAPFGGGAADARYAHCTAFNPATGVVTLDYVDVLTGDEAVNALMQDYGLTKADAEAQLYDYEPNEYIRNQNPQLRTFTMDDTTVIKVLYNTDGTMSPEGHLCTYAEFKALYAAQADVVTNEYQLYSVVVRNNKVVALEQVYRP
jgi:hypothetical protein